MLINGRHPYEVCTGMKYAESGRFGFAYCALIVICCLLQRKKFLRQTLPLAPMQTYTYKVNNFFVGAHLIQVH